MRMQKSRCGAGFGKVSSVLLGLLGMGETRLDVKGMRCAGRRAKALSERIGTALVNGTWFVRKMQQLSGRAIVMHGHRHIDWIGACGDLIIVSAPSPVMDVTDERDTYFYVHTLSVDPKVRLALLQAERIVLPGEPIGQA